MAFSLTVPALALISLDLAGLSNPGLIVQNSDVDHQAAAAAFVRDGSAAPLGGAPVFASIHIEDASRSKLTAVSFHMRWLTDDNGDRRPIWFARRRSAEFRTVSTDYADGRTCPSLQDTLQAMENLELPLVDVIGIPFGDPPPSRLNRGLDSQTFSLSLTGEFRSTRGYGGLTVSGDQTSPVAALSRLAEAGMMSCWTQQQPVWVTDGAPNTAE